MPNLRTSVARMFERLQTDAGVEITYEATGGSPDPFTLIAVKGRRSTEVDIGGNIQTYVIDEFIVSSADLLDLLGRFPRKQDKIIWVDEAGITHTQEVNMPGGGREYDYSDQFNLNMRIHTKEVSP